MHCCYIKQLDLVTYFVTYLAALYLQNSQDITKYFEGISALQHLQFVANYAFSQAPSGSQAFAHSGTDMFLEDVFTSQYVSIVGMIMS